MFGWYAFGVQIHPHKVFGSLGYILYIPPLRVKQTIKKGTPHNLICYYLKGDTFSKSSFFGNYFKFGGCRYIRLCLHITWRFQNHLFETYCVVNWTSHSPRTCLKTKKIFETTTYKVGSYDRYKWSYGAPINGLIQWVTGVITLLAGVITPFITGRGPPCSTPCHFYSYSI